MRDSAAMAEGDINYASVVFKTKTQPRQEAQKEEETVYDEVRVANQAPEQQPDANGFLPDKKADSRHGRYQQLACGFGTLCVLLLSGIIAVIIYLSTLDNVSVSQLNQLKDNQTTLMAVNHNLTNTNNKLSSENENLRRSHDSLKVRFDNLTQAYAVLESNITNLTNINNNLSSENDNLRRNHNNLTVRFHNLTQAYAVLESNIINLTAANENLTIKNQQLKTLELKIKELNTQNQELEMSKNNLTEQIQTAETNWNKLNTSRAQWSIDAYCPGSEGSGKRQCKPCQNGWEAFESNCYAINNPNTNDELRTWEEAQEDCRGKNSDLVVVVTQAEKNFVNAHSWPEGDLNQYWIGLRAEDNKWKWVDGTDLTDNSWIQQTPSDGMCAVSVENEGWKAVSCSQKNRWICQMKALSV